MVTENREKVKLYDRVFDAVFRAQTLILLQRPQRALEVLKGLENTVVQSDVQEYLNEFESKKVERAMDSMFAGADLDRIDIQVSSLQEN